MEQTDDKINTILSKMDKQSPKLLPEQIFATGCVWDAWTYVSDLVRSAYQRIVLIDNFVDDRVLSLLDKRAEGVEATTHSRYYESFQTDLKKHNEQYREIRFVQLPQKFAAKWPIWWQKVGDEARFVRQLGWPREANRRRTLSSNLALDNLFHNE